MSKSDNIALGEIVFHVTDPEQMPMLVTGIIHDLNGVLYRCSSAGQESIFFRQELSTEKSLSNLLN